MEIKKDDQQTIKAWTFYDWANSVFPLVITSAIFPNFYDYKTTHDDSDVFIGKTVEFFGMQFENQNIYSFVYAFALFIVVMIAPILSGVADYLGNKKRFLQFFCYLGSISCMCLFFFTRDHLELSFLPFITATVGFWGSLVYYNSYLPEIASVENQDKVSARGFAMGYFGSSLLLIICLVGIMVFKYEEKMIDGVLVTTGFFKVKYSFLLTGIWWLGFAQFTFRRLPNQNHAPHGSDKKGLISKGFKELRKVAKQVVHLKQLKRFLYSYFFYNMGVQTVMYVASLFGTKELHMRDDELIITVLIIQFVAIAGAYLFAFLSSKAGNIKALLIAVTIWIGICWAAYFVATSVQFFVLAFAVGMIMGGIQSLSRSTYSKMLPKTQDHASYFSFYDVCDKIGLVLGTVAYGYIEELTGSMRNSILVLMTFFVVGLFSLLSIRNFRLQNT